jgi:hypothetical protein
MSLSTQLPTVPRSRQGHRGTPAFAGQWTVARLKAWLALRPYAQPNKALSCANVSPTRHGIGSGARSARASISVASNVKMVSVVIHGASIRARLRQLLGPPPGHRGGSPVRAVAGPGLSYHSYRTTREPLARRNAAAGCYHPARRPECPSMRPPPHHHAVTPGQGCVAEPAAGRHLPVTRSGKGCTAVDWDHALRRVYLQVPVPQFATKIPAGRRSSCSDSVSGSLR